MRKSRIFKILCLFISFYLVFTISNTIFGLGHSVFNFFSHKILISHRDHAEPFGCDESRPLPNRKIAIISASTPSVDNIKCAGGDLECSFVFYLPLASLAWRRLGYGTAVLITGDERLWKQDGHYLNFVYKTLIELGDVNVLFLPASDRDKTGLAQVGRLFVPDMEPHVGEPDTYMVMSDADIFPIINIYDLPSENFDIRVTNGKCCGPFRHKGEHLRS